MLVSRTGLSKEELFFLEKSINKFEQECSKLGPAIFSGYRAATEYDSKIETFSTRSKIVLLPGGRKLFLICNYRSSWFHRRADLIRRSVSGCKMAKAQFSEWKNKFEEKSLIPVITNDHKNIVILEYIASINLFDLFFHGDEIRNYGECEAISNPSIEDLLSIVERATRKISEIHGKDITWGELNLNNLMIDKTGNIHICDAETFYDKNVALKEQKARDLFYFILSASAPLNKKGVGYPEVIKKVLDNYEDKEVIKELKIVAEEKPTLINIIFFEFTRLRLALRDHDEYLSIKKEIANQ
jgi:tRNA A-37 threonylcarbamoyl transferase component Bud32